ncbi:hypothetical protein [Streptomyces sp. NPDC101149]|uniref:hypothetical protein n=1 Tax=Streptomyces sp. NPDC101149 TaxID=3366113 RepID=UPI0037F135E8
MSRGTACPTVIDLADLRPGRHQLLIRRNRATGELAYYRCLPPQQVRLATLTRVAGLRWRVEKTFQAARGVTGQMGARSAAVPPGPAKNS